LQLFTVKITEFAVT